MQYATQELGDIAVLGVHSCIFFCCRIILCHNNIHDGRLVACTNVLATSLKNMVLLTSLGVLIVLNGHKNEDTKYSVRTCKDLSEPSPRSIVAPGTPSKATAEITARNGHLRI